MEDCTSAFRIVTGELTSMEAQAIDGRGRGVSASNWIDSAQDN